MRAKEFINEAFLDFSTGTNAQRKNWLTNPGEAKIYSKMTSEVGETPTHTIHKIDKQFMIVYYAKKKGSRRIDATINAEQDGRSVHIVSMATNPTGEMKMATFIHFLVTELGLNVGSAHYSPGGKKVMERVGQMPGVVITYWKDRKQLGLAKAYSDTEDTDDFDRTYIVAQPGTVQ